MSSTQERSVTTPSVPARSAEDVSASCTEKDVDVPVEQRQPLSIAQMREVVRLVQCPVCSRRLRDPVSLPCGRSLCRTCLPESHLRSNISYPATPSRLHAFRCPFPDCDREHPVGDCDADITVNKVVAVALAELEKARSAVLVSDVATHVVAKDIWEETGVPTLRQTEGVSRLLRGGRLSAMLTLVESGELDYHAEVTYATPTTSDQEDLDAAVLERAKAAVRAEMDCQICYALFCDPVTTACGHTFCRRCLQRVLDHAKLCPVCRRVLTVEPTLNPQACPPNYLLTRIISTFWADLVEVRRQNLMAEVLRDEDNEYDIPVFVCTLSFPCMPTFLHVFEPRYRLMIRRVLEGDRMFGMALYLNGSLAELGTLLRIVNVEFYPDGRSIIETVGVSRFRIVRHGVLDGYIVAKTQRVHDISVAEEEELEAVETRRVIGVDTFASIGSENSSVPRPRSRNSEFPATPEDIETLPTQVLMDFAADFVRRMSEQSVEWLATRMLTIYGECPRDPSIFPWWFTSIFPVTNMEKYRLLSTTSVRQRLKICCGWILEWERSRRSLTECLML